MNAETIVIKIFGQLVERNTRNTHSKIWVSTISLHIRCNYKLQMTVISM